VRFLGFFEPCKLLLLLVYSSQAWKAFSENARQLSSGCLFHQETSAFQQTFVIQQVPTHFGQLLSEKSLR
jgi:hypothetical protein